MLTLISTKQFVKLLKKLVKTLGVSTRKSEESFNQFYLHKEPIYFFQSRDNYEVEVALQWTDGYTETLTSYANNINTPEGGVHVSGFKTALTRVLNNYAKDNNILKNIKISIL